MEETPEGATHKILTSCLDDDPEGWLSARDRAKPDTLSSVLDPRGIMDAVSKTMQKYERELITRWMDDLKQTFNDLYDANSDQWKEQDRKLAERGWFPDPDMTIGQREILADAIKEESEAVDRYMCDVVSDDLDRIETALTKRHPKRAGIIVDAFEAHRQRKFCLSVCVFISQSEGLLHDSFERSVFTTAERIGIHKDATSNPESPITDHSFYLLSEKLPCG